MDGFNISGHQVPDFDSVFSSGGDPLEFGVEGDLEDGGSGIEFSGVFFEVFNVPDVEFFVFSSGGDVFSVGGDGNGVDVGFVGFEGVFNLDVGVPDFQSSVPSYRGEVGSLVSFGGF